MESVKRNGKREKEWIEERKENGMKRENKNEKGRGKGKEDREG